MNLRLSVITATRNRTQLLARALRSVACQSLCDFEVIVVDDGSPSDIIEHHRALIAELGGRFRLMASEPRATGTGPAATRNRGVQAARGEFVAFLDDDDEWVSDRYLEWAFDALTTSDADYLFGHLEGIRDGCRQNPGWVPDPHLLTNDRQVESNPPVHELSPSTLSLIAGRFMIHPSNSVVRRETLLDAGGFFEGLWSHGEDLNLMLRVLDRARRVLYLSHTVTQYRLPIGDSVSLTEREMMHSLQRVMAAQQARLQCRRPELRALARSREAWTYRELAQQALASGENTDARVFARQAFATNPSAGTAIFLLANLLRSWTTRTGGNGHG